MAETQYTVCILIVTYGDRWHLLERILQRLNTFAQVAHVVVMDNASTYDVASKAKEICEEKVTVLTSVENLGSAGGYKKAIEYAVNATDANLFMLLDDDNLPAENVMDDLLRQWPTIDEGNDKKALFCFRDDRRSHVMIAKGEDPDRFYLVPDNFLGFHLFRILSNKLRKTKDARFVSMPLKERVIMPYVPYGGLLIHRRMIELIGYPDERFYLYVDDSEFTYRITQQGGHIWMIPACRIIDIDKSQGINYKKRLFHEQLLDEWSFRTYYHVRNRVYFYSRVAVKNEGIFRLNKVIYLAWLRVISLLSNKTAQYKKLKIAINDGLQGNLGKAASTKF
ncbi:MAG: glycosyltransferase [Mucilaginibacter sp.]